MENFWSYQMSGIVRLQVNIQGNFADDLGSNFNFDKVRKITDTAYEQKIKKHYYS